MRALAPLLVLLAGCPGGGGDCQIDQDCSGSEICARNGECHAASDVRTIHVTWTIRGMPASSTTCATTPNFYILFSSPQVSDTYGYEPVPCAAGLFTIDKLPKRFNAVELGVDGGYSELAAFDAQGNATFDLAP
ncbi:MAG TPA: hypothetical protein VLB44_25505 [Kofleriaceae bacterium]|nr:hypothetical protein [Kofleriaceae bacterium]